MPRKIDSLLTNCIVYDLETHITHRARPYNMTFYRLSKVAVKNDCENLTPYEYEKCKKDTLVLEDDDCITKSSDFCLKFKGEKRKIKNKIVEFNLQLHVHTVSGFDTWNILNNLCNKNIVDIIENGKGKISSRVFNGYIQIKENKTLNILFLDVV